MAEVVTLNRPGGLLKTEFFNMVLWAKENCPTYITNDGIIDSVDGMFIYQFYFTDSKDATLFTLKWLK